MSGGGDTPQKTQWKVGILNHYSFGEYSNKILRIEGPDKDHYYEANKEGVIQNIEEVTEEGIAAAKKILEQHLGEIESCKILIVTGLDIGDDVPNWDSYTEITI